MVFLNIYKTSKFFFSIPLLFLVDKESYDKIEAEIKENKLSCKIYPTIKLNESSKDVTNKVLNTIYCGVREQNKFGLFNDIHSLQFVVMSVG
jgi:hypothetical protein